MKINELQKSALQEAGNIGSGHAAIALSQLMGKKIMIAIPSIEIYDISYLEKILSGNKKIILVTLKVLGDIEGVLIMSLEEKVSYILCDIVMGQNIGTTKKLGEIEQSALKEIGNIVSSSYLNAISSMTGLSILISAPSFNIGTLVVLEKDLIKKGIVMVNVKDIICITTEFIEVTTKVEGNLLFIPINDAVKKIMKSLRV